MLKNILFVLSLISFSFPSQAGIDVLGSFNKIMGKPPACPEIISKEMKDEILGQFLYPDQNRPLLDFSVIGLLTRHLISHQNTNMRLGNDIEYYSSWLNAPFGFKNIEGVYTRENFRMSPTTSFYFYISLLTFIRDIDESLVGEYPFSLKKPFNFKKALLRWADTLLMAIPGQPSLTDEETIYPQILAHRSQYFEMLAYRFFEKNKRLDSWGSFYRSQAPREREARILGSCKDDWNRVQWELNDYKMRLGSYDFATNIATLTKTPMEQIKSLKPDNYTSDGSSSSEDLSHFLVDPLSENKKDN